MSTTLCPRFCFSEGKLLVFTESKVFSIQSWPELTAVKTQAGVKRWQPFIPVFRLLRPLKRRTGNTAPDANLEKEVAFRAFRFSIPPEIVTAAERFPSCQWSVLRMCQANEHIRELTTTNPALGFCLANLDSFSLLNESPIRYADLMAQMRQRDLLGRMGFPRTESCVRLFAKILPEATYLDSLLRLREALRDELVGLLLSHLERINTGVLTLATNPRFRDHITPKLLQDVMAWNEEESRSESAILLADLQSMWTVVNPDRCVPRFQTVAKLREMHAEVSREYCQRQMKAVLASQFPNPPLPGTEDIIALTTPEQLLEEGAQQLNCVGTYAKRVAAGYEYIYRVLKPERATLAIQRGPDDNWTLSQLRAKQNAPVTDATYIAVEDWLKKYSLSV